MFLFVICGLALIISLGLPGATQNGGGYESFGSKTVASVGTEDISTGELAEELSKRDEQLRKMFASQLKTEQGRAMYNQFRQSQLDPGRILDELIQRRIFYYIFDEQKLEVSRAAIRDQLETLPYFKKDGVFSAEVYKKLVAVPNQFENGIRDQLKSQRVMAPFAQLGVNILPSEVSLARAMNKKREFEVLEVPAKVIKQVPSVSEAQITDFLADPKHDAELQNYYNRNIKTFKQPEEISARHILIKEEDGGLKKAKEVNEEIDTKKISFVEAAKKYSKDVSNASKGGELGYFAKGVMDPEFEKAAFALRKTGDKSDVVKSSFGYHLIQLIDRKPGTNNTFADSKKLVTKEYLADRARSDQVKGLMANWLKSPNGPTPAQLKPYGLSWTKTPWGIGQRGLGTLPEKDIPTKDLLALNKSKPLLPRVFESDNGHVLIRYSSEKEEMITAEEVATQKMIRILDSYFQRYKKNLEAGKKITRSEKLIAEANRATQI